MQEGTPPATGKFMEIVNNIFEDYKEWILLIHDNMLILAHTSEVIFERIKLIVRRCFKHNMFGIARVEYSAMKPEHITTVPNRLCMPLRDIGGGIACMSARRC